MYNQINLRRRIKKAKKPIKSLTY